MASFDTGWQNRTGWYLSVPYAMRVSGNVYRVDPWTIRVEGTAQLQQTSNTWGYEQINTEIGSLLGRAMHKPRTTSYTARGSTWNRNFGGNFNVGTGAGHFGATFHGASTTTSGATVGSEQYLDFGASYPTGATQPTGLSLSNVRTTESTVTANVKLSSWGEGATGSRYRELQVGTSNSTANQYWQTQGGGSLSGDITVSKSSNKRGSITLTPNTRYYLGLYAYNGSLSVQTFPNVTAVTLATATATVSNIEPNEVTIAIVPTAGYRVPSSKIQYRRKGVSNWSNSSSVSGNGSVTIKSLMSYSEYEYRIAVTTTDGTWYSGVSSFKTLPNMKIIKKVDGVTSKKWVSIKLIYPDGRKRVITRVRKVVV